MLKGKSKNLIDNQYEQEVQKIAKNEYSQISEEYDLGKVGDYSYKRDERIKKYGKNNIESQKFHYVKELFESLFEPFNLLLLGIGIVELVLYFVNGKHVEELVSFVLVISMIILAAIVDYIQEYKAYKINVELHVLVVNKYRVLKENVDINDITKVTSNLISINETDIAMGDVIYLSAGDVVPNDVKILWSNNFTVNQSMLTGENDAINKSAKFNKTKTILELNNIAFAQSTVSSGNALGLVIHTGEKNYSSAVLKMAMDNDEQTDYEIGLKKVTKIILIMLGVMFPIILVEAGVSTHNWVNSVVFALSVIVALIPEALPAIISGNLQWGSKKLAEKKLVIKNFRAVQNLGSVNIVATDKTGTLTNERINLKSFVNFEQKEDHHLLEMMFINAAFQTNVDNPIDAAILESYSKKKINFFKHNYSFLKEEPFDFVKRRVSVIAKKDDKQILVTKGSSIELLDICTHRHDGEKIVPMSKKDKENILKTLEDLSYQGLRNIVVATKIIKDIDNYSLDDMVYEGFATFDDQIKEDVPNAVKLIYQYGVDLKILTGDALHISMHVANQIGINNPQGINALDITDYSTKQFNDMVSISNVLTKLNPIQKGKVIDAIHEQKGVVAYLGDGVNDVLALSKSDVAISVNNGTAIAKQAADAIMLEKDLTVIEEALIMGRKIFTNALKFIKLTLATNMGLLLTLIISTLWFNFDPMLPLQLLLQNLIYDFSNLVFVFDNVDDISVLKPKKWNTKGIIPFALWNGLIATMVSIINFLIIGYGMNMLHDINSTVVDGNSPYIDQFRTMFFVESFVTHMMLIFTLRTERISLIQSRPSVGLTLGILGLSIIPIIVVFVKPIADLLGFMQPDAIWWAYLAGLVVLTWVLAECSKYIYKKVFKYWI